MFNAGYKNRGSSLTSTLYCDLGFVFADVARSVKGALTPAGWIGAYQSFGRNYAPVTTFATDFVPSVAYGASEYRQLAYSSGCSCISYTSGITPIG